MEKDEFESCARAKEKLIEMSKKEGEKVSFYFIMIASCKNPDHICKLLKWKKGLGH